MMTHVSLFTGIGGLDLAAEWAGFETVLQVERDPYCLKVLDKHWPDVPRITDIKEVHADDRWSNPTVVSGGFPCQPFSAAGKRGGRDDDRYLWPEMLRVIRELSPTYVVAENVSGLLSLNDGAEFETVLSDLERAGYETLPFHYPAASIGANHRRDRVFIGAHAIGDRRSEVGTWESTAPGKDVANAHRIRWDGRRQEANDRASGQPCQEQPTGCSTTLADTGCERVEGRQPQGATHRPEVRRDPEWWAVEPDVGRVAYGVPRRVDRLRALGNAVVPQQAYPIFATIAAMEYE